MLHQRNHCPWEDSSVCACSWSLEYVKRIFAAHYNEWFKSEYPLWESLEEDFKMIES